MREKRFYKPVDISPVERERIMNDIIASLSQKEDIIFAYIYGSFRRGEPSRDIDVALYMKEARDEFFRESDLSYELSTMLGYQVDVKIINRAPVSFQMEVLRDGVLLFSHDEDVRTDFIERTGKRYIEYSYLRNFAMAK